MGGRLQNTAATKIEQYRYDAHGHRARTQRGSETVWQVYSQSGDLMFERTSGGSTLKYARLGGRLIGEIRGGGRFAIHTDVIGSVRQKTNAMGTIVDEDVRAPYGSVLLNGAYRNGPAFTGHMEDGGTGLTYMKARYYDPVSTRFLSPDPVYVDLGSGANFNRYWYANNNPYTYVDPDGREVLAADRSHREAIETNINSRALGVFKFDDSGSLKMVSSEGDSSRFSRTYQTALTNAIESDKKITISIAQTVGEADSTTNRNTLLEGFGEDLVRGAPA